MNPPMNPNQGISYISHSRGVSSLPMMLGTGNQSSLHLPPTLDMNDFPSLGDASINQFSQAQMGSRTDYSGMVRDNGLAPVNQIEFNIQSEDFPALPGVAPGSNVPTNSTVLDQVPVPGVSGVNVNNQPTVGMSGDDGPNSSSDSNTKAFLQQQQQQQHQHQAPTSHEYSHGTPLLNACYKFACHPDFEKEVNLHYSGASKQFSADGDNSSTPSLFPKTLLRNPYGMLGLLKSIREKPFYGIDLTTLGQEVYPSEKSSQGGFSTSLFCDIKPRCFEKEVPVPDEYHVWDHIGPNMPKLPDLFKRFKEDSLFLHFYLFNGSKYQRLAANELFQKDWRFHKGEKIWIRRKATPFEEEDEYERGYYYYFDFNHYKLLHKEMKVYYQSLELDPKIEYSGPSSSGGQ